MRPRITRLSFYRRPRRKLAASEQLFREFHRRVTDVRLSYEGDVQYLLIGIELAPGNERTQSFLIYEPRSAFRVDDESTELLPPEVAATLVLDAVLEAS